MLTTLEDFGPLWFIKQLYRHFVSQKDAQEIYLFFALTKYLTSKYLTGLTDCFATHPAALQQLYLI